eukprot:2827646-Prymnesium_polylepis.1
MRVPRLPHELSVLVVAAPELVVAAQPRHQLPHRAVQLVLPRRRRQPDLVLREQRAHLLGRHARHLAAVQLLGRLRPPRRVHRRRLTVLAGRLVVVVALL